MQRAHESLTEGYLDVGSVNITDANLSRSLYAYMNNPAEERALYTDSVDKEMTMLRFQRASDGLNVGVLTWFPVHGTSIYGVSGGHFLSFKCLSMETHLLTSPRTTPT